MVQNFVNIFTAPSEAFASLKEHPTVLPPVLLLIGSGLGVSLLYFAIVDFDYFIVTTVEDSLAGESADVKRQAEAGMRQAGMTVMMVSSAISTLVMFPLLYALHAFWFWIVGFVRSHEQSYANWFSLVVWGSLPILLSILASLVVMLLSENGQISATDTKPLSLPALLDLRLTAGQWQFFSSWDLTSIWSLILMVIGYRTWTGSNWGASALVVFAPFAVIALGVAVVLF